MKANPQYVLRTIGHIHLIVPLKKESFEEKDILTTNESGALLWNCLKQECTKKELLYAMQSVYDIDDATALSDIDLFLQNLQKIHALL